MKPPKRLFRNRPPRDDNDLSDMDNVNVFTLAARLLAGFYHGDRKLDPDATRAKVRALARYSLDTPWRGILPVPFDQSQQEVVSEAMMRAVEDVLSTGVVVPKIDVPNHKRAKQVEWASHIATFLIDHHPDTPSGPEPSGGRSV